ncbi:unnamed protein product, partial [Rotaria sp. Silwood1]
MGSSTSSLPPSIRNYPVIIKPKNGKQFSMMYHSLIEHILLLRKVINHPEMSQEGPELNYYINDYCKRMSKGKMRTYDQQENLPWQLEWICHVHRLHPLAYLNDCNKQLSDELVDKKCPKLIIDCDKQDELKKSKNPFSSNNTNLQFIPSIDLRSAVIRQ